MFDNGLGERRGALPGANGDEIPHRRLGLRRSRRVHRPESLTNVRISARLGGLGNPVAAALLTSDVVLDISGGDSFSDLYGPQRFRTVVDPKRLALRHQRPLILLPQTYGPFRSSRTRRIAVEILRRADMAWARDADSHEQLRGLLGTDYDPTRHLPGVDVAFRLPARPTPALPRRLASWLATPRTAPVAGLNVSGLLYNERSAADDYGLADSYPRTVTLLLRRLLEETDANVVLVPHVLGDNAESDQTAVADLRSTVGAAHLDRVEIAPAFAHPGQVKSLIAQLDWFCGTRMHSTIAALSSGVPVAAIAYSLKSRGVFATCGLGEEVVDARRLDRTTIADRLLDSWRRRAEIDATLSVRLPAVLAAADHQLDVIADRIRRSAAGLPAHHHHGARA